MIAGKERSLQEVAGLVLCQVAAVRARIRRRIRARTPAGVAFQVKLNP